MTSVPQHSSGVAGKRARRDPNSVSRNELVENLERRTRELQLPDLEELVPESLLVIDRNQVGSDGAAEDAPALSRRSTKETYPGKRGRCDVRSRAASARDFRSICGR